MNLFSWSFTQTNWTKDSTQVQEYTKDFSKFRYSNIDSANFYLEKIFSLQRDNKKWHELIRYKTVAQAYTASYFFDLEAYEKIIKETEKIIAEQEFILNEDDAWPALRRKFLHTKGDYYSSLGQHKFALQTFSKIEEEYKAMPTINSSEMSYYVSLLDYIGIANIKLGDYHTAINYFKQELSYLEQYKDSIKYANKYTADTKKALARTYDILGDKNEANKFYNDALAYYLKNKDNAQLHNTTINTYHDLIRNLIDLEEYDAAQKYLTLLTTKYKENDPFARHQPYLQARLYHRQKNWAGAEEHYNYAINVFKKYRDSDTHRDVAEVIIDKGRLYLDWGELKRADSTLNIALNMVQDKHAQLSFKVLDLQAQVYHAQHNLNKSMEASHKAIAVLDELKPQLESKLDKLFLLENAFPMFDQAMQTAFTLYEQTGKKEYLDKAFYISEKSKGTLLLEAVRQTSAHSFAGVPDSVITQQDRLQTQITRIEKSLLRSNDGEKRQLLTDSLAKTKIEYFGFIRSFEQSYPKYFDLKYKNDVVDLASVQRRLKKNEGVLHYYAAGNTIYAFLIEKNNVDLKKVTVEDLPNLVANYHRLLSAYGPENSAILQEEMQRLTAAVLPFSLAHLQHVTVVPDGPLYYIPFETLQTPKKAYLLETTAISFAPSSTVLVESISTKKRKGKGLLGLAPSFNTPLLSELPFNGDELNAIATSFKNKQLFYDSEATKAAFQEHAGNARFIHLATHAKVNDEQPDFTYLAFAQDSGNENQLYLADIYNSKLQADLVSLSACETAIGELMRGEGLVSLSRGFTYAGASSVLTSLWKVDDKSTAQLMEYFYKHLNKGASKATALQKAKQDYLANAGDPLLMHPYYWAGFVLYGDDAPIKKKGSLPLTACIILLGLAALYLFKKRLRK